MTDQEKQKLKNKLAMLAGWHEERYEITRGAFALVLLAPNEQLLEGHIGYILEHTPNFPGSLDDCFEWVFKPVCDYFIAKSTCYEDYQRLVYDFLSGWVREIVFNQELHELGEPNMEALYFCLAVEKLIDGGKV